MTKLLNSRSFHKMINLTLQQSRSWRFVENLQIEHELLLQEAMKPFTNQSLLNKTGLPEQFNVLNRKALSNEQLLIMLFRQSLDENKKKLCEYQHIDGDFSILTYESVSRCFFYEHANAPKINKMIEGLYLDPMYDNNFNEN